jgi:prepilin-type N-terminal cleavage/methylation domain-containing protein
MSIQTRSLLTCHALPAKACSRGFTLVEVVVGLGIFALVIASFFQAFSQGFMILESTRDLNRVTQVMQTQVENLRGVVWVDFEKQVGTNKVDVTLAAVKSFKMEQSIVADKAGHYQATLVATWTDSRGRNHTKTFVTWFSKNGLNNYYTRST